MYPSTGYRSPFNLPNSVFKCLDNWSLVSEFRKKVTTQGGRVEGPVDI